MHDILSIFIPAWLEHASANQQFFTLTLPILLAVLVMYSTSILWEHDPEQRLRALIVADQRQLGHRRFTPARRWFSAFTLSLAEAQAVVRNSHPVEDVLDLEVVEAESELLAGLGGYAESDEVRSLQDLVSHFRREVLLEAGDDEIPGLAETWVGYGTRRTVGLGAIAESETTLRIFNAEDLGYQLISRTVTRGIASGLGSSVLPVAFTAVGVGEPTPADIESAIVDLFDIELAGARRARLVAELLATGESRSVQASTSDNLVETIQSNSRLIGRRGDVHAWMNQPDPMRWGRRWTSTIVVSGGPGEHLPAQGRALISS